MAPPTNKRTKLKQVNKKEISNKKFAEIINFYEKYVNLNFAKKLIFDPEYIYVVAIFLFICEVFINSLIVIFRPYTEIDWRAYMQEVEGFLNGTLDYQYLKGDTGPLVYPAGFVYLFSIFYFLTDKGTDLKRAQWIFAFIYLLLIYQVFRMYCRSRKVPPYAIIFLTFTSYRIHSIFVLRLFNDPIAILLMYFAINCFLDGRWTFGSLAYSLGVAVKMNILLFSPALLIVYLTQLSIFDTIVQLAVCGCLQVVLAMPFLLVNPWSYISRSFDLGRVFLYEWTVNWKFIPEEYFVDKYFHFGLLFLHLSVIGLFVPSWLRYLRSYSKLEQISKEGDAKIPMQIRSQLLLFPLLVCNFIGICFSRSLHYQFYVWYYHSIPYLLWSTNMPIRLKLAIFGIIELCWNVFPANFCSSLALLSCHLAILFGLWQYRKPKKDWKIEVKDKKN